LLDLAKILAKAGDLPHAIARARQVEAPSERLAEARALEGAWRDKGPVPATLIRVGKKLR
jgi:hypothetical protein